MNELGYLEDILAQMREHTELLRQIAESLEQLAATVGSDRRNGYPCLNVSEQDPR